MEVKDFDTKALEILNKLADDTMPEYSHDVVPVEINEALASLKALIAVTIGTPPEPTNGCRYCGFDVVKLRQRFNLNGGK